MRFRLVGRPSASGTLVEWLVVLANETAWLPGGRLSLTFTERAMSRDALNARWLIRDA